MQTVTNLYEVPDVACWDIQNDRRVIHFQSDSFDIDVVISVIYLGPDRWRWTAEDNETNLCSISKGVFKNGDVAWEDAVHHMYLLKVGEED